MLRKTTILSMMILLALSCGLSACSSSDDPANPGGGGGSDTTAPQVSGTQPQDADTGVSPTATITINFNEAMSAGSESGQVTLSSGAITDMTWTNDRTLAVNHDPWADGAHVTVTLGTGLQDAAGNALAAYTFDFWVFSSVLSVLDTNPANGATGVNRSANIQALFSQNISAGSVAANTTISDVTKANYPFGVTVDGSTVTLMPESDLPADTEITVTFGANVMSTNETTLGTPASFSFTTSNEVDTTPPTVVSTTPASGSTFAADAGSFTIVFSEPMDPNDFEPSAWNVEFALVMVASNVSPTWSADMTTVTVALPSPLPAGLPCEVTFASFTDANGNVQTTPWTWSATVSGTPDYYPTSDGYRYIYEAAYAGGTLGNDVPEWSDFGGEFRQVDVQGNGSIRLAEYADEGFTAPTGSYELYRRQSNRLEWIGFADGGTENLFDSPLNVLPLPVSAGTWSGSTTVTVPGEGTFSATLNGSVSGPEDMPIDSFGSENLYYKNVFRVIHVLDVAVGGSPAFVQRDTMWVSPTLGPVHMSNREEDTNANEWTTEMFWRYFEF